MRHGGLAREGQEDSQEGGWTHQSLGLLDVFMSEEELSVEIAEVDCVEINDVNLPEPSEDKVFEKLAADAAGAYEEDARLGR